MYQKSLAHSEVHSSHFLLLIVLFLCLTVLFGYMPAEAEEVDALPLILDTESTATITTGGQIVYFSFTPSETGLYSFSSSGTSDTYGYLYDADLNQIAYNDDDGENRNFLINYSLTAGTRYYFGARYYSNSSTGSFQVLLTKDNTSWSLNNGVLTVSGSEVMTDYDYRGAPWCSLGSSIESVIINGDITSIGSRAFYGCFGLTSFTIPNSVTSIGSFAFSYCSGLTSVTIPGSVISIGEEAFSGCSGLTSITIPNSVTNIGSYAFFYCSGLTSVTIPGSVISIGEEAFYGCSGLTSITIENGVKNIGNDAFFSPGSPNELCVVVIPSTVTQIGYGALASLIPAVYPGSAAERYCQDNGIEIYILMDGTGINDHLVDLIKAVAQVEDVPLRYRNEAVSVLKTMDLTNSQCDTLRDYVLGEEQALKRAMVDNSMTASEILGFLQRFISMMNNVGVEIDYKLTTINGFLGVKLTATVNGREIKVDVYRTGYHNWIVENVTSSEQNGYLYVESDDGLTITGYSGDETALSIPASIGNKPVVSIANVNGFPSGITSLTISEGVKRIGDSAFAQLECLETLILPGSLESIGNAAFVNCSSLTSITIPSGVTSIGNNAFSDCSSLASITIPNSVTSVGDYAFFYCTGLTSITIPNSVTSIGYGAFSGCSGLKTAGPIGGGYNYEFGWTNSIPVHAFSGCSDLTSITIPTGVTSIGNDAFSSCSSLMSITIPNSVTSIGNNAFSSCSSLTDITIPTGVTSIGNNAFSSCSSLMSITIPNSVTSIGSSAFFYCSSLGSITIPNNVTSIGNNAFSSCSSLTDITIPTGVTSIGSNAFSYCSGLTNITIPNSVTSIGSNAFYHCSGLTSITIPNSVTSIGYNAFCECSNLTSVTMPENIADMGMKVFEGCTGLADADGFIIIGQVLYDYTGEAESINIPFTVKKIGDYAFYRSLQLLSVVIPDGVTAIGRYAFGYCSNLTDITIPSSVTSIGDGAFTGCSSLQNNSSDFIIIRNVLYQYTGSDENVVIPDSVTSIGDMAFAWAGNLKGVTIPSGVTSIGNNAFNGCESLESIVIPEGVTFIGDRAFAECSSLTSVTIPGSVTRIGKGAFSFCGRLNTLVLPTGIPVQYEYHIYNMSLHSLAVPVSMAVEDGTFSYTPLGEIVSPDLVLPENLTVVEDEAFAGTDASFVYIPASVSFIGGRAFAGCDHLRFVWFDNMYYEEYFVSEDAFAGDSGLTLIIPCAPEYSNWCSNFPYMEWDPNW